MPQCFCLTRKGAEKPTPLNTIDAELCDLLGVPVHPQHYVAGWFDSIGYLIASGRKLGSLELWAKLDEWTEPDFDSDSKERFNRQVQRREHLFLCLMHLEEHYTDDAWVEIGRRD